MVHIIILCLFLVAEDAKMKCLAGSPHGMDHDCEHEVHHNLEPCDSECERFRELMKNWPADKPKSAIVILTQVSRLKKLEKLFESLDKYFLNTFQYPVVIFHEENYRKHLEEVRTFSKADIFFQEVEFKVPEFINESQIAQTGHRIGKFCK